MNYYLHIWSTGETDKQTIFVDRTVHPPLVTDVGLEVDAWPADDLFYSFPVFIVSERLKSLLQHWGYTNLVFHEVKRLSQGLNFADNYPDTNLPRYWHMEVNGTIGADDFALWENTYFIVSEKALAFLRDNHVTHAEADMIDVPIEEYFTQKRQCFWIQ